MGTNMNLGNAISAVQAAGPLTQDVSLSLRPKLRFGEAKVEIRAKGSLVDRS